MLKHKIVGHSKKQRARRQEEKRGASLVADHGAKQRAIAGERRRANSARAETRHMAILRKRDPVAFKAMLARRLEAAGVVKPVFETRERVKLRGAA